jgi:WD40 repeat protein
MIFFLTKAIILNFLNSSKNMKENSIIKINKADWEDLLIRDQILTCSFDCTFKLIDLKSGTLKKNVKAHKEKIWCLKLLPTGELATGSEVCIYILND